MRSLRFICALMVFGAVISAAGAARAVANEKYPAIQAVIDEIKANDPQIEEFNLYAVPSGGNELLRVASHDAALIGQPGHTDNLLAVMEKDRMIVFQGENDDGKLKADVGVKCPVDVNGKAVAVVEIEIPMVEDKNVAENMAMAKTKVQAIVDGIALKIAQAPQPLW